MLFWPAVAVLGFVLMGVLVIVLGTSSTSRYEFERNRVQAGRTQAVGQGAAVAAPVVAVAAGGPVERAAGEAHPADSPARVTTGGGATLESRLEQGVAVSVANHPAGKRMVDPGATPAWWLVDDVDERTGGRIVGGPFADRLEADWAALSTGAAESAQVLYGLPRADGVGVVRRQLPQEREWLAELGDQLDRLDEDWDALLTDEDSLTTLVVEVAAALVEAGLSLHDCAGSVPAGGVCLTPDPAHGGIVVSWHRHDRMGVQQLRGAALDTAVQLTMNAAIADLLVQTGFGVELVGSSGCCLVTDAPR